MMADLRTNITQEEFDILVRDAMELRRLREPVIGTEIEGALIGLEDYQPGDPLNLQAYHDLIERLAAQLGDMKEHYLAACQLAKDEREQARQNAEDAERIEVAVRLIRKALDACTYDSEGAADQGIYGLPPDVLIPMTLWLASIDAARAAQGDSAAPEKEHG